MQKKIFAISFVKSGEWHTGNIIQVGVAEERVNELREYAKSLGYEENSRGPLVFPVTAERYNKELKKDFKEAFKS